MKIAFIILLSLHSLIHLIGFSKAFWLLEARNLGSISKSLGMVWLISALFIATTALLFGIDHKYWWVMGFISAITSQILIFSAWKEARFGSIINLLLLILSVMWFVNQN